MSLIMGTPFEDKNLTYINLPFEDTNILHTLSKELNGAKILDMSEFGLYFDRLLDGEYDNKLISISHRIANFYIDYKEEVEMWSSHLNYDDEVETIKHILSVSGNGHRRMVVLYLFAIEHYDYLLIDMFGAGLHPALEKALLQDLLNLASFTKFIITGFEYQVDFIKSIKNVQVIGA